MITPTTLETSRVQVATEEGMTTPTTSRAQVVTEEGQTMTIHPVAEDMEEGQTMITHPVVVDMEITATAAEDNPRDRVEGMVDRTRVKVRIRTRVKAKVSKAPEASEDHREVPQEVQEESRESLSRVECRLLKGSPRRRDGKEFEALVVMLSTSET